MQQRKYYLGILPAEVSKKECADTAMAMTLICLLAAMYLRSFTLLPVAVGLLLLGMANLQYVNAIPKALCRDNSSAGGLLPLQP